MRIERLKLKKTNNTRDIGGLPTADGRKIKCGKLIRSGRLYKLPASSVKTLQDMQVDTVIDFRIDTEISGHPATIIPGAKYYYLPLLCTATAGITSDKSMTRTLIKEARRIKEEFVKADNYMIEMYRTILFTSEPQKKLKTIFDLLIEEEKCILWNCNSGKDRTGLVAMLIEGTLGVERDIIVEDYLASRKFQLTMRRWQRLGLIIAPLKRRFKNILRAFMEAKPEYINSVLDDMERDYGGIVGYVKNVLGVTDAQIELLKEKYLE